LLLGVVANAVHVALPAAQLIASAIKVWRHAKA
jgi:hypothetical protein